MAGVLRIPYQESAAHGIMIYAAIQGAISPAPYLLARYGIRSSSSRCCRRPRHGRPPAERSCRHRMMRGDFVQSGRRGILDVLAGETHTIRHLMGGDHLDERLADAGAGHRHRGLLANVPQPGSGESPTRPCIWLVMPPVDVPAAILPSASRATHRWCHASPTHRHRTEPRPRTDDAVR